MAKVIEPCECLKRVMRAVDSGRAHCSVRKLYGETSAGTVRGSRVPFPSRSIAGTLHLRRPHAIR
jgi:hypothetical protein